MIIISKIYIVPFNILRGDLQCEIKDQFISNNILSKSQRTLKSTLNRKTEPIDTDKEVVLGFISIT